MISTRKMISATVAAALVATSVTPAFAGGRGYGYGYGKYKYGRHYRRDRIDTGDVIGFLAIAGLVAAIATSGKSKRRARDAGVSDRDYDSGPYKRGSINSENDAVDACALAAEDRAGKMSSVRDVTKVAVVDDGWDIAGTIEARDDWRDKRVEPRGFTCVVRDGTVRAVFVDVNSVAER